MMAKKYLIYMIPMRYSYNEYKAYTRHIFNITDKSYGKLNWGEE